MFYNFRSIYIPTIWVLHFLAIFLSLKIPASYWLYETKKGYRACGLYYSRDGKYFGQGLFATTCGLLLSTGLSFVLRAEYFTTELGVTLVFIAIWYLFGGFAVIANVRTLYKIAIKGRKRYIEFFKRNKTTE